MKWIWMFLISSYTAAFAQFPSGDQVIQKIDQNMSARTRIVTSKMIIHGRRGSRTIESKTWVQGEEKSFTEYLSPAREKGTKMLKLADQLWIYSPATDRIVQIAGHMLRQSLMGSDLSYEDVMEDPRLETHYRATVVAEDTVDQRVCWVLELTAKTDAVAYSLRKLWVDQERSVPLREELYAKSGTLLKRLSLSQVSNIGGRWFPKKMIFKDMLKEGQGTEFIVISIQFDQPIPETLFSKAALRK